MPAQIGSNIKVSLWKPDRGAGYDLHSSPKRKWRPGRWGAWAVTPPFPGWTRTRGPHRTLTRGSHEEKEEAQGDDRSLALEDIEPSILEDPLPEKQTQQEPTEEM